MYEDTFVSRVEIGHGEVIERIVDISGRAYTSILKWGREVATAPTSEEDNMIRWWKNEGWQIWRDRKKK